LAHQETLNNKGITVAVLGTGIDAASVYPYSNRKLATEIIKSGGVLISEFPPKTPALPQNFPQRNRIISGLCQATLVIEAKEKSGSLITASYALDQNREILAIPGNIFSEFSGGTNNLIKAGAKTITKTEDILDVFKIETPKTLKNKQPKTRTVKLENEIETKIYTAIKQAHDRSEKITTDEIIKITKLDTATTNSTLSILELRGIAKNDEIGYDIN
jgi:DNA processing protein